MTAIRRELPSGLSDSFLDFSEEPLASGSVAQTHRARLLSGQEVIVKIQRPGIDEVVKEDIQLLIKLCTPYSKALYTYGRCSGGFGKSARNPIGT